MWLSHFSLSASYDFFFIVSHMAVSYDFCLSYSTPGLFCHSLYHMICVCLISHLDVMQTLRSCDCGAGECQAGVKYVDQLEDVLRFSMPKDKCGAFFAESIQVHVSFQCSCSRVILKLFNMRYLSFRNWFWIGYFILSADIGVRFIHDT